MPLSIPRSRENRSKTPPKLVRTEAFQDTQNYFKTGPSKCWECSTQLSFYGWLDMIYYTDVQPYNLKCKSYNTSCTTWEVEPPTYPPWSLEPTYPTLQKGFGRGYISYQEGNQQTNSANSYTAKLVELQWSSNRCLCRWRHRETSPFVKLPRYLLDNNGPLNTNMLAC